MTINPDDRRALIKMPFEELAAEVKKRDRAFRAARKAGVNGAEYERIRAAYYLARGIHQSLIHNGAI